MPEEVIQQIMRDEGKTHEEAERTLHARKYTYFCDKHQTKLTDKTVKGHRSLFGCKPRAL